MNIERPIFEEENPEAEAECLSRARADVAAGRTAPHSEVKKWLETWGTPEEGPPPAEWFKRK